RGEGGMGGRFATSTTSRKRERHRMLKLDQISIVLYQTRYAANIGAVARAMKNMGLSDLVVVAPRKDDPKEAAVMAVFAVDLYDQRRVFTSLDEALAPYEIVIGTTSARRAAGKGEIVLQQPWYPRELARTLQERSDAPRIALLFGAEHHGLPNRVLERCDALITIPTAQDAPVLNLAQSVMLCAYEFFLAAGEALPIDRVMPRATHGEMEALSQEVEGLLRRIDFLCQKKPRRLLALLRRIARRAELTPREVRVLRAFTRKINGFIDASPYFTRSR
ncbi:MAG: TrmJ/YjtD family RNA methyltransferase, partial [Deltaproteobacteria bacterium]